MRRIFPYAALAMGIVALYAAVYQLPAFGDWDTVFYHVPILDPYSLSKFLNPPWTTLPLLPFRLLPQHAAGALWVTLSILAIAYCARQLGSDTLGLVLIFTCPFFWFYITLGQLDVLLLIGLLARPPFDVLLLAIKPHVIGTAILFKAKNYLWNGRQGLKSVGYLAAVIALSLVIWPGWPMLMIHNWQTGVYHPLSLDIFPYGLPIGVFFLAWAWRRQNVIVGGLAMYFMTPYVGPASIIVYATLIFSTFTAVSRLAIYTALWALALVLLG
jgi:hypothetical protein